MYLNNLKRLIKQSGLKKNYIAQQLNIQYDTFRRKLNGETEFKISEIFNLCKLLKINIKEIFEDGKED